MAPFYPNFPPASTNPFLRFAVCCYRLFNSCLWFGHLTRRMCSSQIISVALGYSRDPENLARVSVHKLHVTTGADVVFYMEPTDLDTHDFSNCYMIIVQGAKNVINACQESKVKRLVYYSSADVFYGSQDILNGDESFAYPGKSKDMTVDLKFEAEGLIRLANKIGGLQTCVLCLSDVFGSGETQFVPLLVNLAKFGLAKILY
ncbi:hypothetical protein V6Z12_D01G087300 [Gossypium hirsutum]